MEQLRMAALLEKYWRAETTVEEERQLAEYFRQPVIPAEWEPWRNVFAYFEAEARVTTGKDFEDKLLERIRQVEAASGAPDPFLSRPGSGSSLPPEPGLAGSSPQLDGRASAGPAPVRPLSRWTPWWAAAAVMILALGVARLAGPATTTLPATGPLAASVARHTAKPGSVPAAKPGSELPANATDPGGSPVIKDTYDDPRQALAAIRRALGTASAKMNHGTTITQRQMDRMNDGWQSAIAN